VLHATTFVLLPPTKVIGGQPASGRPPSMKVTLPCGEIPLTVVVNEIL
jgi:hypothetical protein